MLICCFFQVPLFQRGGSAVCRSTGSGSCTAELQKLPLTITVALNSQVSVEPGVKRVSAGCAASHQGI